MARRNHASRRQHILCGVLAASMVLLLAACNDDKTYDIGPIFPVSADKCARYDGEQKGEGLNEQCLVTKDKCEEAAADWRDSVASRVPGAIVFTC